MRNISHLLTLVAAALLLPAAATAQDATNEKPDRAKMRQRMIEQFDADGDGKLSEEERAKARAKRGAKGAKGGQAGRGGRGPQGREGRPEGPPDPMRLFERFDANGDNQLSREEFMKLTKTMREMRERRGAGGPQGRQRGQGGERRGPPGERGDRDRFRPLQNPGPPPQRDGQRGFRGREGERGFRGPGGERAERSRRGPEGRRPEGRRGPEGRGPEQMGQPNPERLFRAFDENGDDQLSREEFKQLSEAIRERMGHGGPRGLRRGPPEGGRRDGSGRSDRPRRPPPELEGAQSTEPAAEDNSV